MLHRLRSLALLALVLLPILAMGQPQPTNYTTVQWDTGTTIPGFCSSPGFFYKTDTTTAYACVSGHFVSLFSTSGLTVASNGYVGIGTSTPQAVLDVNGQLDLLGVQGLAYPTVDTTANGTILIGSGAGTQLPASAAYGATAIGYQALGALSPTTAATGITAVGFQALNANTSGSNSTAVGYQALASATTTTNTAVGFKALATGNPNSSTAVGFNAQNAGALTNGVAVGSNSCSVCTGTGDTALGANAGRFVTSGARNVAVGQSAIQGITGTRVTGSDNTAVGDSAGLLLQGAAASNTIIGSGVGSTITTGTNNLLIGNSSTCELGGITNSNEMHICAPAGDIITVTGDGTVSTELVSINGVQVATGTAPTITGCGTISAQTGGVSAGTFTTNTTGTCTAAFAMPTAPHGWVCAVQDITKHVAANIMLQSATSASSCTVTGTTAASDVLVFTASAY